MPPKVTFKNVSLYLPKLLRKSRPFLLMAILLVASLSIYLIFNTPMDARQGNLVKIMFIHVPAAWLSMLIYVGLLMAAISFLIWRSPINIIWISSFLPLAICFCLITLTTGIIWGKPSWGIWWVWDARLTSFLILFLFYLTLAALQKAWLDTNIGTTASAWLIVIGAIDLPIIKFSVDWWNSLHQSASILGKQGITINKLFLYPLITNSLLFVLIFLYLFSILVDTMLIKQEIKQKRAILNQLAKYE